jgi:CPA2 family monovalent cation:H+ antiporter-2
MVDFAITMFAALVGGLFAYRLRLPMPLGYIAAGIFIGPNSFELVEDVELIETMARVGVVLLLFTLGMEFSIADLRRVGPVGLGGGVAQIILTALLGFAVGRILFDWSASDATFFAFLIALSSTTVVLKILV